MAKKAAQGRFRVVLVSPEYELNVGAAARAMKNFGFSDLAIVSPRCDPRGFDAIMHSKHARDVLEGARTCKTLAEATAGCALAVGTTGVLCRHHRTTIRSPMGLRQFAKKLRTGREGRIALVFGSEGVGLSEGDVSACDFLLTIPTSDAYPVLNLSHAVAIVLYELSSLAPRAFVPAGGKEKEELVRAFCAITGKFAGQLRNPRKVKVAFRRIVAKSMATDKECAAVLGVMKRAEREILERQGQQRFR